MDDTTRLPRPASGEPKDPAVVALIQWAREPTFRHSAGPAAAATAVLVGAFILAAREAFGSVGVAVAVLGVEVGPDPAPLWRVPVSAWAASATCMALCWYFVHADRRGAAGFAVIGGLGLWVLLGVPLGVAAFVALLAVAGWWRLPDRIERAGGHRVGCSHGL